MTTNHHVPVIRFKGFTDAWEQCELSKLIEQIKREVPKPNKPYYRMSVRSHAKGTFKQFVDDPEKIAMNKLYVVKKDDLVVNITFAWEHAIAVVSDDSDGLLVSHRFPTYRADNKSDIVFLEYLISKEEFRRKLEFISPGGAGRNRVLNQKDFLRLKVIVPRIQEQTKVGNFFKQLDDTIALHQRELDLLKEQKKGFLQKMFPKKDELVPEIRFAGFTDAWELRKLGDLADTFEYGLNASAKEYDGQNKYLRITDIDDESRQFKTDSITSPNIDLDLANNYILKKGDILFARTGASVGKTYRYIDTDGIVYYAGFLIRARINHEFNAEFIFQNTLTDAYCNYIKVTSQRSGQPGVNAQEYAKFEIKVPEKEEQTKIGNFFKQLDDTIALHQCELEKLQEMKKAFLQKMFV